MEAQEKEKITEGMKLCESKMQSFFKYLEDTIPPVESSKLRDLILEHTFFAGGVFRSALSGSPIVNVDVFFKSLDSVLEFKHLVMSQSLKIFEHGLYAWKNKGPKVVFSVKNYGRPETVIGRFGLSFNQHYYDMQKMEMRFNRDTFNKAGWVNYDCEDRAVTIQRALWFMNQGWKVEQASIIEMLKTCWSKEIPCSLQSVEKDKLGLLNKLYTDRDYFGRGPEEKKSKKELSYKTLPSATGSGQTFVVGTQLHPGTWETPQAQNEEDVLMRSSMVQTTTIAIPTPAAQRIVEQTPEEVLDQLLEDFEDYEDDQ